MDIISKEDAQSILEPHKATLIAAWNAAWEKWEKIGQQAPDARVDIRSRAQANVLYDLVCSELKRRFTDVPGVSWSEKGGFLTLNFEDKLLLRFKKFDDNLKSHNVMTQQQVLFRLQLELPGFPSAPTRATLGYQLDKFAAGLRNFLVACHVGDSLEWIIPIIAPADAGWDAIPLPSAPEGPTPQPTLRRKGAAQERGTVKKGKGKTANS